MRKKQNLGFSTFELLIALAIVCILGTIVLTKYSEIRQSTRNDQRKTDITTLQTAVDTYKAANGKYPSLAQINNSEFRKASLKNIGQADLQDPKWSAKNSDCVKSNAVQLQDSTKPSAGCYGYALSPATCDNAAIDCTSYTLTANLEPNQTYSKQSSD